MGTMIRIRATVLLAAVIGMGASGARAAGDGGLASEAEVLEALAKIGELGHDPGVPEDEGLYRDAALMEGLHQEIEISEHVVKELARMMPGAPAPERETARVGAFRKRLDELAKKPQPGGFKLDDAGRARVLETITLRRWGKEAEQAVADYRMGKRTLEELQELAGAFSMMASWGGPSGGHAGDLARREIFGAYGVDKAIDEIERAATGDGVR